MKFVAEVTTKEILLHIPRDELSPQALRKHIHDLKAHVRTIHYCIDNIKSGYRFDDDMAEAKLAALEKAAQGIEHQFSELEVLYRTLLDHIDPLP